MQYLQATLHRVYLGGEGERAGQWAGQCEDVVHLLVRLLSRSAGKSWTELLLLLQVSLSMATGQFHGNHFFGVYDVFIL